MDETDKALILKRDALESLIDKYYDKKNEIFNAPKDAIKTAVDHFEGQINNIQDITIKNIIATLNKNTTTTGFLLDVALSCVLGVVVGYLAESIAKPFLKKVVDNRNRDLDTLNLVNNNVKLAKLFNIHQDSMASLVSELKPELSEHAVKLIKGPLSRPMLEVAQEVKMQARKLGEQVSVLEFVERYTAAGNDIIQATWGKFIEKGLPDEEKKKKEDEKKTNIGKLYNKTLERNVFEAITKMSEETGIYARLQIRLNNLFRDLFQFLRRIIFDLNSLDALTKYFQNQLTLLDQTTNTEELERIYTKLFESIFWLLYLGNPIDWVGIPVIGAGSNKREMVEEIKEDELSVYTITHTGEPHGLVLRTVYRFIVSSGEDSKRVKELPKNHRWPHYKSNMEQLYRPKLNINIPYDLLSYLTRNFGENFGTESFLEEAIRKKKVQYGEKKRLRNRCA